MAVSLEVRIKELEDKLKALKGSYSTAGSALKLFTTIEEFTVGGSSTIHSVRFKFTPTFGAGKINVVDFSAIGVMSYFEYTTRVNVPFRVEPQDGSGNVYIDTAASLVNGDTIRIIATGTSPGTITML